MARRAAIASDDLRLARAFGIVPTRKRGAAFVIGGLGLIGVATGGFLLIPAGAVALGLGGFTVADVVRVRKRLAEVAAWDFPVEGYRAWILAAEPAFDLELRREVPLELVAASLAAVDTTIAVERRTGGILRVVTRKVDLPMTRHYPAVEVGDRRLLLEIHERVLAPLHADVGIVAMRMGDRATMTALVRTRRDEPAAADGGPGDGHGGGVGGVFREQGIAAPMALQALVHQGTTRLRPPSDARGAKRQRERVMYATGHTPKRVGGVLLAIWAGGVVGGALGPTGTLVGLGAGMVVGIAARVGRNAGHLRGVRNVIASAGFPIENYEDWLLSGRPIFDLELSAPPDREWLSDKLTITAYSVKHAVQLPWVEDVAWLSDTLVRIETRPMLVTASDNKMEPFYGGSHVLFVQLLCDVLIPLHRRTPIVAVRMGGFPERRADR